MKNKLDLILCLNNIAEIKSVLTSRYFQGYSHRNVNVYKKEYKNIIDTSNFLLNNYKEISSNYYIQEGLHEIAILLSNIIAKLKKAPLVTIYYCPESDEIYNILERISEIYTKNIRPQISV